MSDWDTTNLSGLDVFGPTPWTRLRSRADLDPVVRSYWRPVYRYLRVRWRLSNEDAKDLTQGFFASLLDGGAFAKLDPERGKFRHFLRTSADNFVRKHFRSQGAEKRGGGRKPEVLADAESGEPSADGVFAAEWARAILEETIESLEPREATVLRRADAATYREMAAELRLTEKQVEKLLSRARAKFRTAVNERIARTVPRAELEDEIRELFAALARTQR